jgi:hypothetical protein
MAAVTELAVDVGTSAACHTLLVPRASYYRERRAASFPVVRVSRPSPVRALQPAERETVLAHLHAERFQDRSPAAVYATLLDEGEYHCSIRTMYRLLAEHGEVRERRDQLTHPPYQKPELMATAPNQLWSWDITKLLGPVKWTYFYLYVILDVFSRYVTGWMVAYRESAGPDRGVGGGRGVGLMLHAGRRKHSPRLLLALFAIWVLSPFVALIFANIASKGWSVITRATLYSVMLVLTLGSLAIYGDVALAPLTAKTVPVFVIVPPASWLLIAIVVPIAANG